MEGDLSEKLQSQPRGTWCLPNLWKQKQQQQKQSVFNPPRNTDKILDQNLDSLNSLNFPDLQKAPKSNLSKLEWAAIDDLKNDKNIEIKEKLTNGDLQ